MADLRYREPVDSQKDLPLEGNEVGDIRVEEAFGNAFKWQGTKWVPASVEEFQKAVDLFSKGAPKVVEKKKRVLSEEQKEMEQQRSKDRDLRFLLWDNKVSQMLEAVGKSMRSGDKWEPFPAQEFRSRLPESLQKTWDHPEFQKQLAAAKKANRPGRLGALGRRFAVLGDDGLFTMSMVEKITGAVDRSGEASKNLGPHSPYVKMVINAFLRRKFS